MGAGQRVIQEVIVRRPAPDVRPGFVIGAGSRRPLMIKNDAGDIWTRAANYHSRSPQQNATYRADLMVKAKKWADWLAARFVTLDVTETATGSGASTNLPRDRSRYISRKPIHKDR